MDLPHRSFRPSAAAALLALPLAAGATIVVFAAYQPDPQAAAESGYLALVATCLLLCLAAFDAAAQRSGLAAPGHLGVLPVTTGLAVALVWALPAGPVRGGGLVLLLAGALGVAAVRAAAGGTTRVLAPHAGVRGPEAFALLLPAAVALQLLVRSDRLLEPALDLHLVAGLLGLPAVAAAATALLAGRHGPGAAAVAAGSAALVGPGFTTATAGALVVLCLAEAAWRPGAGGRGGRLAAVAGLLPVLGLLAWREPAVALLAAGAALALGHRAAAALAGAAVAASALALAPWPGSAVAGARLALAAVLLPSFPAAFAAAPDRRDRLTALAVAVVAALAGAGAGPAALAAPLGLAALAALGRRPLPGAWRPLAPQAVWTGLLVTATALAAAYPWLHRDALGDALEAFGLAAPGAALAAAVALAWAAAASVGRGVHAPHRGGRRAASAAAALAVAAAIASLGGPPPGRSAVVLPEVVALDAAGPRLVLDLRERTHGADPLPIGSLVVDSNLSHATGVVQGTAVATVRVFDGDGRSERWVLRAGRETAEWAARRPDVSASARHRPPVPWLAWVAPGGEFFGLTFRSRWSAASPLPAHSIVVERNPRLPEETVVHLYRLEAGP